MTLSATARLGPYEIVALLGAGGMGEVYKARDTRLNRTVAIKVLPAHVSDSPDLHQRFAREAQLIAALEHPHICVLHDVSEHDGIDFLVMEYIEGETLADRLKKGPLPLVQALRHAIEITDALDRAHRRGIVHRDLKPGNIMITKSGVKLLDFGLAKFHRTAVGATPASAAVTQSTPLTDQGTILGTIHYMAPEQLEGQDTDARTDIFAFGATLFEMVTGRKAFEGKSRASLIAAILEREPPPASTIRPSVPPLVDHIVGRCLAKDPDERWQSASDLRRELEWVGRAGRQLRWWEPVTWGRWRTGALVSLAGLGLFLAGLSAARIVGSATEAGGKVSRFVLQLPVTDPLDPSDRPAVALSRDGSRLVYVAAGRETTQLWVRRLDQFDSIALPGTEGASGPFFSPDGEWIGFFAAGKLMKISASGGVPATLCGAPLGRGATWGDDGTILFTAAPGAGLWRVPANGGSPEVVTRLDETQGDRSHRWPEFLPGAAAALFTLRTGKHASFDETSIRALSFRTGRQENIVERGTQPVYMPGGYLIYARGGGLHAARFDSTQLKVLGTGVTVVQKVMSDSSTGAAHFSTSDDGSLVYVPGGTWEARRALRLVDRESGIQPPVGQFAGFRTPRWSPDGQRLAVMIEGATDSIWILHLGSNRLERLTFEAGANWAPVWTPDGTRMAFASNMSGAFNIYWKSARGGEPSERLTTSAHAQFPSSWSPDGRILAYAESDPVTGSDLWVVSPSDGRTPKPFLKSDFNEYGAAFSPDGRWLAYWSDESGRDEVYVHAFPGPGEKRQVSQGGGSEPAWNPNGRELFYRKGNSVLAVAVSTTATTFSSGAPQTVFTMPCEPTALSGFRNYDVARGGGVFVTVEMSRAELPRELHVILNWVEELKRRISTNP